MVSAILEVVNAEAEGMPEGGLMDGSYYECWAPLSQGQRGRVPD